MKTLLLTVIVSLVAVPLEAVPLQSIVIGVNSDSVTIISKKGGTKTLSAADIPPNQKIVISTAETVANAWAAVNITDCVVVIHIYSLSPFRWTIWTSNLGTSPPANWWLDP